MSNDLFQEWRTADRAAWAVEKAVFADSLAAIEHKSSEFPAAKDLARAKHLRGIANDLYAIAMHEMAETARKLRQTP